MDRVASALACSSLVDLLLYRAEHCASQSAYTFLENGDEVSESITYRQLAERALALATFLRQSCSPQDRVLLLYPPCVDYMVGFFACLCAGLVAVPLFPPRGTKHNLRLEAIAQDCRPRAALMSSKRLAHKHAPLSEQPTLSTVQLICSDTLPADGASAWVHPGVSGETIAFLQYTSGSTGLPKGVMVSHSNLLHNERMLQTCYGTDESSTFVSWLPIYHDMGLIAKMLSSFWLGSECVFMAPVAFLQRPIRWLRAISKFRAYISGAPNFAFDLCVDKISQEQRQGLDLSSWKVAFNGAEPIRFSTLERFAGAFEPYGLSRNSLHPCYGLAENTVMVSGGRAGKPPVCKWVDKTQLTHKRIIEVAPGAGQPVVGCGRTVLEQEIQIVDEVTREICPPGSVGEVWVSGPSVAQGYWGRHELSVEVFNARIAGSDKRSFLRTGDLGFLDDGELYLTGRIKDVIIVRGANHYPQDIEATIEAVDPSVNPAGVGAFGVSDAAGERVVVVVEVARTSLRKVNTQSLVLNIRRHVLEEHDVAISDVVLIRPGGLPKSSSGKVQRSQCRMMYLASELEELGIHRTGVEIDTA